MRKNLFFKKGDQLVPYLIADNERYLRDLPYLNDADISVVNVNRDSVDIIVLTKDVLSLGGSIRMHNTTKGSITISDANIAGTGQELLLRSFFDNKRVPKFGYGGEYNIRNIGGSFIDWYGGYISYNKNFASGFQNEDMVYTGILRPLVNPYAKFTYAATAAWHRHRDWPVDLRAEALHPVQFLLGRDDVFAGDPLRGKFEGHLKRAGLA